MDVVTHRPQRSVGGGGGGGGEEGERRKERANTSLPTYS